MKKLFCDQWEFALGQNQEEFDWQPVNLPHDWAVKEQFQMDLPGQTGKLPCAGIGWYRKCFQPLETDCDKRFFIDFDGAMSQTKVWLNGQYIGGWPYGYTSFRLELTDHLKFGQENVLTVRLNNPPDSSRWYTGGGIYRNVWLVKTAPIHVAHWGTAVTVPEISEDQATVKVVAQIENQAEHEGFITVKQEIFEESFPNRSVAEQAAFSGKITAGCTIVSECSIELNGVKRWDVESPNLYVLRTRVIQAGQTIDTYETVFGIRTLEFSPDQGFCLNGRHLKLNGVCLHHDLGPLGAAVNRRAIERQLEIMKEMGCNAIRTTHNPPAPEVLDLCDRMGILVIDEVFDTWAVAKTKNDYSTLFSEWHERDLTAMIRRDRNHPCVIMWSTGNEVMEQWPEHLNPVLSRHLSDLVRKADPTRPVTAGCSNPDTGFNGFAETMDVFGYNYKPHLYGNFREQNPTVPLYGSETSSCISSRGEYFFPVSEDRGLGGYFQVSSYDLSAPAWGTVPDAEFAAQDRMPEVFGEFVWTGFDYLGEPTPYNNDQTNLLNFSNPDEQRKMANEMERLGGNIPPRSSYFGIVDLCGFPKDRFYLYQSKWRQDFPMAHILSHWNWPERIGQITPVHVYTSGDEAELFLNGKTLGRKKKDSYEYRLRWDDIVYEPGELKVAAYKNGKTWAEDSVQTTGPAFQLKLSADRQAIRADGKDLSFITVKITDSTGLPVPRADNLIRFELNGSGEIIATGSGNPVSHESFQAHARKAFNGLCLVVIRSLSGRTGKIVLSAESAGFPSSHIELHTN
ncbi:MAG: beta-galactosidase GalB [Kiritimatiellales bacterium]